jgi:hypothetical protein
VRFTPSDAADHINLNKIFQRPLLRLKRVCSAEIGSEQLFREFCIGSTFDFFNGIGQKLTCSSSAATSHSGREHRDYTSASSMRISAGDHDPIA